MKSRPAAVALVAVLFASIVGPARADVSPDQVRKAIERGTNYLWGQQRHDGSWPDPVAQPGGISALCTLALLYAGVEPDDPRMQKAITFLGKIKPERTYVVSLQTMVFARAGPDRYRDLLFRNVKWLEATQITEGPNRGAWSYPGLAAATTRTPSSRCWPCTRPSASASRPSDQTWRLAKKYWEECQNADGSWGYTKQASRGTGSMTCAGITSLAIAADRIQLLDARVSGNRIECCTGNRVDGHDRIDDALRWLGQNYSVSHNPQNPLWHLYYLYGLERAGRLTARRFIPLPARVGQTDRADWYREGAEWLVRHQESLSGFWTGSGYIEDNPPVGTSLAPDVSLEGTLAGAIGQAATRRRQRLEPAPRRRGQFDPLRRIAMAARPDLAGGRSEAGHRRRSGPDAGPLPLRAARVRCPTIRPSARAWPKSCAAISIAAVFCSPRAIAAASGFDRGFRSLMKEMFPEPEYQLRLLEPEHPIWYAEEKVDPDQLRPIWGVEFGCRTSVVYAPVDPPGDPRPSLSCLWELSRPGRGAKYSAAVQAQIDAALSLGINVLAYATNRELKTKEDYFRPTTARRPGDQVQAGPARRGQSASSRRMQRGAPGVDQLDGRGRRAN